jgi:cation transporter-like permease
MSGNTRKRLSTFVEGIALVGRPVLLLKAAQAVITGLVARGTEYCLESAPFVLTLYPVDALFLSSRNSSSDLMHG